VYAEIVSEYWEQVGVAMKERLKADRPHAVIDLVAAGAGFVLVPSVQEPGNGRIVRRRLNPTPPELELSLAWAREVESPAINALLEVARQVVGQPKSRISGEGRARPLRVHSLRQTGHARANTNDPGAPPRAPPLRWSS